MVNHVGGSETRVDTTNFGTNFNQGVTRLSNGNYLLHWYAGNESPLLAGWFSVNLYGQIFSADGTP